MSLPIRIPGDPTAGWLILIGGGEFSFGETEEIDRFALERFSSPNRNVAFVPTASGSQDYGRHFAAYLTRLDPTLTVSTVPFFRPRDARRGKNLEQLRSAGMIYLGGGVAENALEAFVGSTFAEELRAAMQRGAVVVAMGAAAACMGVVARDREGRLIDALAVLPDVAVEPGFDKRDDSGIRVLMAHPAVEIGLAIEPGTALAIAPDRSGEIVGRGNVAVVRRPPRQ